MQTLFNLYLLHLIADNLLVVGAPFDPVESNVAGCPTVDIGYRESL